MEKKSNQKLKICLIILVIILISCISFIGIYTQKGNRMTNILPEYILGTTLKGYREIGLKVNDGTKEIIKDAEGNIIESATDEEIAEKGYTKESIPVNAEDALKKENYIVAKQIIENRLKEIGETNYEVRLNEETGHIVVRIKEDSKRELALGILSTVGKFEIQDNDTKEVLMDNNDLKVAKVLYQSTTSGTSVYLGIEFTKEGKQKLADISKKYTTSTDEEGNKTEKKIKMLVDDTTLITTSFDTPMENGELQLSIGRASTNSSDLQKYIEQGTSMKTTLNNGNMPVAYTMETNQFIEQTVSKDSLKVIVSIGVGIAIILAAYLIIRYHANGVFSVILTIGILATTLLILRFTNVEMSKETILSLGVIAILNYIFSNMYLKRIKKEEKVETAFKDAFIRFMMTLIPMIILAVVFSFITTEVISNIGMVLFWGILVIIITNLICNSMMLKKNRGEDNEKI